jgi:hypothetical protein
MTPSRALSICAAAEGANTAIAAAAANATFMELIPAPSPHTVLRPAPRADAKS